MPSSAAAIGSSDIPPVAPLLAAKRVQYLQATPIQLVA